MPKDNIIASRLDLIAARSKILAEQYKNNQLWDGQLSEGLDELERELSAIRRNSRGESGWGPYGNGLETWDR